MSGPTVLTLWLVSRSQTFRLTAESLEYMAAFIGQGPPMTDMSNNQSQIVSFSVMFRGVAMLPQ